MIDCLFFHSIPSFFFRIEVQPNFCTCHSPTSRYIKKLGSMEVSRRELSVRSVTQEKGPTPPWPPWHLGKLFFPVYDVGLKLISLFKIFFSHWLIGRKREASKTHMHMFSHDTHTYVFTRAKLEANPKMRIEIAHLGLAGFLKSFEIITPFSRFFFPPPRGRTG